VTKVRVTGTLLGVAFAQSDTVDARTGNVDDWIDFDGASNLGSNADAWLECRQTDDNPSGSPTWSAWKRLDAAEFACWGMQLRVQFRSYDPAYNVSLDTVVALAEKL